MWNGKIYVGDSITGLVWLLDLDVHIDNENSYGLPVIPIKRVRTGGHIHDDRQRLLFHSFELDFQRGVGTQADDNNSIQTSCGITTSITLCTDPQVCLQWSDDGGFTWSNELWQSAGKVGEYLKRVVFYRLGMSRDRVFRVKMSDAVKWIIIGARASIEKVGSL